ncbi:MAG: alpha-amylase, partial [Mycobacterium sp.]|nr:alpha-amylase [Mycobacterium sp.]
DDSDPRVNDPGVHAIHRRLRRLSDEYPGTVLVGEIWVDDNTRFGEYVRPDELHLAFNFRLAQAEFTAESIRSAIENSLAAVRPVGAAATWTLSNHDVVREVTRYGGGVLGQARARAMALVELALPGAVFVYNGSELGLPEVTDIPAEALRDPIVARSSGAQIGRDGCRVPLPWSGDQAPFGFSSSDNTWLPMPDRWRDYTVERQDQQEDSMLALYRRAIAVRRKMAVAEADIAWLPAPAGCLRFRGIGGVECWVNTGNEPIAVGSREMLLASAPMVSGGLPSNAAVWFAGS